MDEIWERAVETALEGQTDIDLVRTLTLDGVVKCIQGRLPSPSLFQQFQNLQHLSMANIGASSLEQFPRLRNLQKLILSDNRIASGLEFLVAAGLESLRDLDLSNNRISNINDLSPLAELRIVSLDLYECPVTRIKDYRSRVFGLIRSLKYLDKMDAEENERPESDDEEDDEDEDEDDPGCGEIDGDDHSSRLNNGQRVGNDGVVDVDEEEDSSDADEEAETSRAANGSTCGGNPHHQYTNGFRVEAVNGGEDDQEGDEDDDSVEEEEEVYEDDGEDDDVVEVHDVDGEDGDDDDDDDDDDEDDEEDEEEEVDNDEMDFGVAESTSRLTSTEGEIDAHEQGEDAADEDDDGETGEEEPAVEEGVEFEDEEEADDEEEDDNGSAGYLVQPVGRVEVEAGVSDLGEGDDPEMEEDIEGEENKDDDGEVQELPPPTSHKRKISDEDNDDDDDDDGGDEDEDDDVVQHQYRKSSKHR